MNIAYVSADADVPVFGTRGSSAHTQEMLRALLRRGASVDLLAGAFGGSITAEFAGVRMASIAPARASTPADIERAALAVNATLTDALKTRHRERGFELVYERYSLWSYAGMEFAREQDIPGVLEVNAPLLEEVTRRHLLIHRAAAEDAAMRAFRSASAIVTVSQQLAHILQQHPSAGGKIHVIPNAADPSRFANAAPTVARNGQFTIGFIGELQPWQGVSSLVAAFALVLDALPHSRLLIVGDGPEREPLAREVAAKGLEQAVQFVGAVPRHAIPGYLASMDVAVAPYPQIAGFYCSPVKLFEYMAAGLPIVASRIGQVREILAHEETALLVTPGNREELAEAIFNLEQEPEKRVSLGAAARAAVAANHTWDANIERIITAAGLDKRAPAPLPSQIIPPALAARR